MSESVSVTRSQSVSLIVTKTDAFSLANNVEAEILHSWLDNDLFSSVISLKSKAPGLKG